MTREAISTMNAPAAAGAYSQAIAADGFVFCAGQIPLDPTTGEMLSGSIEEQTDRVLRNLGGVLDAAGCSPADVVKTTVFLADINDFPAMNGVYASFFPNPPPARSTIQVGALPRGAKVEIEAIARRP
jgi:2-iminobutanoate/2-iminopropanoate deaminase